MQSFHHPLRSLTILLPCSVFPTAPAQEALATLPPDRLKKRPELRVFPACTVYILHKHTYSPLIFFQLNLLARTDEK